MEDLKLRQADMKKKQDQFLNNIVSREEKQAELDAKKYV